MSAIPRESYCMRWKVARKIYELGPRAERELVGDLSIDPRARTQFLKSVHKMTEDGNLIKSGEKLDLHPKLRAYMSGVRESAAAAHAGDNVKPYTREFKPLDLNKYPHLRGGESRFVSMSTRVRTPLDMVGEA